MTAASALPSIKFPPESTIGDHQANGERASEAPAADSVGVGDCPRRAKRLAATQSGSGGHSRCSSDRTDIVTVRSWTLPRP